MPITGERKKEANRKKDERQREIKALLQGMVQKDLESNGVRYLSEVLPYESLGKIYYGLEYKEEKDDIDEDEDDDLSEIRKKKPVHYKRVKGVPVPAKTKILGMFRSFEEWLQLRDQARKDLFWLGKEIFKKDFFPEVHQVICDMFVQKNFDRMFPAGYTVNDVHKAIKSQERYDHEGNSTRESLILDPRGFFKSTIDGVDSVQWMINVPDIRIMIMAADHKIGTSLMKEIKGYFYLAKGQDPTDFHYLFPEYIVRGMDGTSKEPLVTPARIHFQRFDTLWYNSIESGLSGWHCDILKSDDVVNDENCKTPDAREILKDKIDGGYNLLDEWGFSDVIGTRYYGDPDPDWYGSRLKIAAEQGKPIKYHCRACWTVKPEFSEVPLKQLTDDMVELTFPQKADFKSLKHKLLQNETNFRCQQLNEPAGDLAGGYRNSFDEDTLRRHLYHKELAPKVGDIYICWDWALTVNKQSDYSAGVAARVYKREDGKLCLSILEVVYDKWTFSELTFQIVQFNKKWNPKKTLIEKSGGAEGLAKDLTVMSGRYGVTLDIYWKPPSLQKNAKRNRIKNLEPLLKDDRLWFVNGSWIDETFLQLVRYTGEPKNRGRKDDIADAMAYLKTFIIDPSVADADQKEAEEAKVYMEAQRKAAELRNNYDRIFGRPQNIPMRIEENPDEGVWKPKWPTRGNN